MNGAMRHVSTQTFAGAFPAATWQVEEALRELNPEAIDFRAASRLFASAQTLKAMEFLIE